MVLCSACIYFGGVLIYKKDPTDGVVSFDPDREASFYLTGRWLQQMPNSCRFSSRCTQLNVPFDLLTT
jgi:hypothetical protein